MQEGWCYIEDEAAQLIPPFYLILNRATEFWMPAQLPVEKLLIWPN